MRRPRNAAIAVGLLVLGVAVAIAATQFKFLQGKAPTGSVRRDPAPEFTGLAGWLNSPPLTIAGLHGHVVLIDFWTYSCINCLRTIPALRELYTRYHPVGLDIVGVHSPEFAFEKIASNISQAIHRNGVPWPVAMDNDMATWRAYKNNYWPHVYLIDQRGTIRFDQIGEGGDDLIQTHLRTLLAETGATLPTPVDFTQQTFDPHLTPEIYAGYERGAGAGAIGNPEGYTADSVVDYRAVNPDTIAGAGTGGIFFLSGRWRARAEYLEAAAEGTRLVLPFFARNVYFVASSPTPTDVRLLLDGKPVPAGTLGADAPGGVVRVSRSDLYGLVRLTAPAGHELTLVVGRGFRLYTFTFG